MVVWSGAPFPAAGQYFIVWLVLLHIQKIDSARVPCKRLYGFYSKMAYSLAHRASRYKNATYVYIATSKICIIYYYECILWLSRAWQDKHLPHKWISGTKHIPNYILYDMCVLFSMHNSAQCPWAAELCSRCDSTNKHCAHIPIIQYVCVLDLWLVWAEEVEYKKKRSFLPMAHKWHVNGRI